MKDINIQIQEVECFQTRWIQRNPHEPDTSELNLLKAMIKKKFYLLKNIYLGATLHGLWDPSSLTRDWTQASAVKAQSPNHSTTREFPIEKMILKFRKTQ